MSKITIGSRGSDLALWQAHHVQRNLIKLGHEVDIKIIVTQGDAIQHLSFDKLEGKGFFTKEIEVALLNKEIDLAVHSHKDLETNQPEGLMIGAVSEREDAAELLLIRKESVDPTQNWSLKANAVIGTSSARRKSQVVAQRSDLTIKDLRGNVPTRIDKLRQGLYDAILLAKAGTDRLQLDLSEFEVVRLDPTSFVPAPAQGVLALQIRTEDQDLFQALSALNNTFVQDQIAIERKVLNQMNGGCQLPLGVYVSEETVYVSFAKTWEEGAQNFTFPRGSVDETVKSIINTLQNQ